jgi:hypothetical protein
MRVYVLVLLYCLSTIKGFSQDTLQHSLLWKISGNGLKQPSYLYGTLQGICKKDIKLKPKLIKVLDNAHTLAFECYFKKFDPYKETDIKIGVMVLLVDVTIFKIPRDLSEEDYMHGNLSLENIMETEKYEYVNSFFKDSLYVKGGIKHYRFFHPLIINNLIVNKILGCPTSSHEQFMGHKMADIIFQYKGLDSVRETAAVNHNYKNYETLANEIYENVKNYSSYKNIIRENYAKSIEQYKAENINHFRINSQDESDKVFIIERNLKWIPEIERMIKKHNSVIAVEVKHLSGENGLIDLLKAKGYSVTAVLD